MSLEDILMNSADLLQKAQLDAGGFGMVSLCYHKRHGLVVLKTVYTGPKRAECNASLLEEGKIMQKLNHDRVVKLLGVILEDGNYSLVMEYVHKGNLMRVLKTIETPLPLKARFILEIIEGMLYLSEEGLVHKDLKPENILVDEDFHIKIADLGVACFKNWSRLTKEETSRQRKLKGSTKNSKSSAGTLSYMAPEHLKSINITPVEKSDVYSFGIVLWAIFAQKEPYENATNDEHMYFRVMQGDRPDVSEIKESCPEIISLMEQCWSQNPEDRPNFAEINEAYKPLYHQKFQKYIEDDVQKIKQVYPEPNELVKRMQSLQVDAVAGPPSSPRIDLPSSLHSSQDLAANSVDEALFGACQENKLGESWETSFEPLPRNRARIVQDVDDKLLAELNYHLYGSRMDKAESSSAAYSAEMREEERRRRVSHDPFVKRAATPQARETHSRAENTRLNFSHYHHRRQQSPGGALSERHNMPYSPNHSYGVRPADLRTGMDAGDMYGSHSVDAVSYVKLPVSESGAGHHPKPTVPYCIPRGRNTEAGSVEFHPSVTASVAQSSMHRKSTEELAQYNIVNSYGIQIGPHNSMTINDKHSQMCSYPANANCSDAGYQKLFGSTAAISDVHLNLVRDNLAKQWKGCGRKLGLSDPEVDEIDHDYERDGLKEKVYQMLHKWQMKEGSKGTTVGKLARALFDCQRFDLLNRLVKICQESQGTAGHC
ncbi:receptor-interacting serine/threonine-protein kinase 1 [Paroedura picta]|uniref:receptor-interacting serine/threonine-protein kinase 1 n=1 Tax=Paroedura picta TaxID=143630 RepID=UPI0040566236